MRLGLSHGARGTVRGFKSNQGLDVRASHGSILDGEIEAGDIVLDASHGSTLQLKGKVRDGRLMVSHGSTLSVSDLALREVEIDVEHGSTATFDARSTESLKVTANHSGIVSGSVEAGPVTVETGHSSKVTLKGRAQRADIAASHGSRRLGRRSRSPRLRSISHSPRSATVNASDTLDYQLDNSSKSQVRRKTQGRQSRSPRSSSARSISADEACAGNSTPLREPSKPSQHAQEDLVISTDQRERGHHQIGDPADAIVGSGNPAAKTWDVTGFDRVQVRSTFRAEITKGAGFKVTTTADDNVLPHIKVVKEGTTLNIGLDHGSYRQIITTQGRDHAPRSRRPRYRRSI